MTDEPDRLDLYILHTLCDEPSYKSKIGDAVELSIQSVGRRVEILDAKGYVTSVEPRPFDDPLSVSTCYETTAAGKTVIEDHRICTGCGETVAADDHEHTVVPATEYFADSRPDQPLTAPEGLDRLDLDILGELVGEALWKRKLYKRLDGPSVQTVGRRVNMLEETGFVDARFVKTEEVSQHLIIGFETTEKGLDVVEAEQAAVQDAEVCRECGEVFRPDDHRHEFVAATVFFADED